MRCTGAVGVAGVGAAAGAAAASEVTMIEATSPRAVRAMMDSRDMAKLRAGAKRHLRDRRMARPDDSCGEVLDLTGRSTTCAACIAACLASLGCSGASVAHRPPAEPGEASHSILADEDSDKPSYGKAELDRALIAERGAEAT